MSKTKEGLIEILAEYFWSYKSYEIDDVMKSYGISPDETLNPGDSKKIYAKSGLVKLSEEEIIKLSKHIAKEAESVSLNQKMEEYLSDSIFEFTYITRRKLAEYLDMCPNFEGKLKLAELLHGIWDIDAPYVNDEDMFVFNRISLGDYIMQHVVRNDDISYKDMLLDTLQIKYISDNSFIKFLEKMVNPEVRTGEEQVQYVNGINEIIGADGFELAVSSKISNELVYKVYRKQIISGNMKNLIFAPLGKKPDIVIDDAINNDLKIVGDTDNCLFYNFQHNVDGLSWHTLVKWWEPNSTGENVQKDLFKRLLNSLDSHPERDFFIQYYTIYEKKGDFPALIPQVYLHYDPYAKNWRGNSVIYTHQRMDFLMLLPNGVRIVFEIDGKQHYSNVDNQSSPKLYAGMALDTRELQLRGYEVYRFGGYEFMDRQQPQKMIREFFESLFKKYCIL